MHICIVAIYVCAFTCGRSFTVLSFRDDLISFGVSLVFSPTLLSLYYFYLIINLLVFYCYFVIYFYCCYYYYRLLLLLFLLFPLSSWLCVMGAWAGAAYGGQGSWLGFG